MLKNITKPSLLVDLKKVRRNIKAMADKAEKSRVFFRPHFKTHQSREIGDIYREFGVTGITVSSLSMAQYFVSYGWEDVTVAFPVNLREIETIKVLSKMINLGLLVDSPETAEALGRTVENKVRIWIKIDVGYNRSGIPADRTDLLLETTRKIVSYPLLEFTGLLTHAGHTYKASGKTEILDIYRSSLRVLTALRQYLTAEGFTEPKISYGDTPSCSMVEDFSGLTEIRPGNFVYYDLEQYLLGSCSVQEIAAAIACPVVGIYKDRNEAVVYGGAVHISKQSQRLSDGRSVYGFVFRPGASSDSWNGLIPGGEVVSLSQEHGIVKLPQEELNKIKLGDLLLICPVHSCLSADLLKSNTVIV